MSKRKDVIVEFARRVASITPANSYATDLGSTQFINETPTLGADDPAAVHAVMVGTEAPRWQGKKCYVDLPIEVHIIVPAGDTSQSRLAALEAQEDAIADVKKAIEVDHDLGGLLEDAGQFPIKRGAVRPLHRESGSRDVGAVLPYELCFTESWGAP